VLLPGMRAPLFTNVDEYNQKHRKAQKQNKKINKNKK
jgi:hypothetical protein